MFSFIKLSISVFELTYPILLLFNETLYLGVYFINIIVKTIIKATNDILSNFIASFV